MFIGLSLFGALEDHHFVFGGAETLFSCNLKHEANQLISMLHQVRGDLISDDTSAAVRLSDHVGVD